MTHDRVSGTHNPHFEQNGAHVLGRTCLAAHWDGRVLLHVQHTVHGLSCG